MEKITKEELREKLLNNQLSDDELEKIAGGDRFLECYAQCKELKTDPEKFTCLSNCGPA